MIQNGYASRNIPSFEKFKEVYETRIAAKKAGNKSLANNYKLVLNTCYGATLNPYNPLYDPLQARSVCISGQLYLLELANHLYTSIKGLEVIALNTDGILLEFDETQYDNVREILDEWQTRTHFELEEDKIIKLIQPNVNNYLLILDNGKVKIKGGYLVRGIAPAGAFNINNNMICVSKAIIDYFVKGTSPEDTINSNDNLFDYQLMRFDFPEAMDIKGITLRFDSVAYPTAFTITTDNGVSSYTNDGVEWVTDDAFSGVAYLLFTFQTMSKDTARFRLKSMLFGYGLTYSNDDIITSEWKTYVSEISEDMPQVDFTVTLKNYDQYFDPDNPMSVINYLDTNMPMEIYYGMTLADQSIEWFRAAKVYVSEWSADNRKAVITATDVFRTMDEIFNKGQYRPNGISLYDLAVEVMQDAGFDEYYIDPYLANLRTKNPLPRVTHKEALQIIANAGRCVLSVDRAGLPEITSSFVPEIELAVNEEASWSQYANIAEDTTKERLATFASDFMLAKDDNLYLQTETGSRAGTYGFISKGVSGADGTFLKPPTIIVTQETAVQRVGLTLKFGTCVPKTMLIQTYTNGVSVENVTISDVSQTTYIPRAFKAFDTMNIRFTETQKPYQLVEVDYLHFEKASEFNLTQDDMLSYPISTNERSVKRIDTIASYYNSTNIVDSLFSEDVTVTANQVMEFYVNEASYDYAPVLKYPDQKEDEESPTQCTVVASGAYFVQVKFPEAGTFKLEMTGKRYNITTQKYSQAVQQRGDVKTWENPLISDISDAKDLTEWLSAYYANNIIYEYDTRGNPELDPNDIVYQESKYVENMKVRIAEQIVRFDGALHGKLVTRRTD